MDTKLKDQLFEIAKSNNLLASSQNSEDSNALLDKAFSEALRAWQAINQEPLLLVKDLVESYPELKLELKGDLCLYDFALIEDAAFSYELNTVMSLHCALPNSKSNESEQEQVRTNANHTFELQRTLPLPNKISRLAAKVMSLGMYAQISKRAPDFHDYLTILLPLVAKINAQLLNDKARFIADRQVKVTSSESVCETCCTSQSTKFDAHNTNPLYECEQNILLLELLLIWVLIFNHDYQGLLTKLDDFHQLLVSFAKDLEFANTMQEKGNFALYMNIILLMEEATKALAQHHLGCKTKKAKPTEVTDGSENTEGYNGTEGSDGADVVADTKVTDGTDVIKGTDVIEGSKMTKGAEGAEGAEVNKVIESKLQTAIDKCDQLHMADLEIIARSLKMILLLDLSRSD